MFVTYVSDANIAYMKNNTAGPVNLYIYHTSLDKAIRQAEGKDDELDQAQWQRRERTQRYREWQVHDVEWRDWLLHQLLLD